MPKVSKVGKFRKAVADAALTASAAPTPANTPVRETAASATESPKEQTAATTSTSSSAYLAYEKNDTTADGAHLSRGQKKRLAKKEQYLRKQGLVMSSLLLKKEQEQKTRIDGLDAIKQALLATVKAGGNNNSGKKASKEEKPNMLKTNKSRQLLMQKEVAQMNLVLQHPSFQEDPFATIRQHLTNTLAADSANQKKEQAVHNRERKEKEAKKKAFKKENGIKKSRKKFKATRSRNK